MTYNLTNLSSATTFYEVMKAADGYSSGTLMFGFMLCVFIVGIFALKRVSFWDAVMVSAFGCVILSIPLVMIGLLNFYSMIIFLIFMFFAIFMISIKRHKAVS